MLCFTTSTLRGYKSLDAFGDIHSQETYLQHPTKPSTPDTLSYHYSNYYGDLGYGLGGFRGLGYGYGSSYGLGGYDGYGVATSVPLPMDDTGHLDSSERPDHYFGIQNVCLIFIIYYFSSKTLSPCTWNFLDQQTLMFLMNDLNALPRYSQLCWKMTYILLFFTSVIFLDLLLNKYFFAEH